MMCSWRTWSTRSKIPKGICN